ncbi:hypothetical protein M0R45_037441 [Rubus argutus]|uniref:Uncharacterized protein n=1 Tax=Rubus argutus TaxID=59490 RepID=A0AAW1W2A0_RUBAR
MNFPQGNTADAFSTLYKANLSIVTNADLWNILNFTIDAIIHKPQVHHYAQQFCAIQQVLASPFPVRNLWSNMPPVPIVKMVTVRPFLKIFCTGDCPTLPQIIACAHREIPNPSWDPHFVLA